MRSVEHRILVARGLLLGIRAVESSAHDVVARCRRAILRCVSRFNGDLGEALPICHGRDAECYRCCLIRAFPLGQLQLSIGRFLPAPLSRVGVRCRRDIGGFPNVPTRAVDTRALPGTTGLRWFAAYLLWCL